MRLLDVHTFHFREFADDSLIPRYAIASHRWRDDEISYQQYLDRDRLPAVRKTKGFDKIIKFCEFVRNNYDADNYNLKYLWIDTICINKSDFSELHEAINSMWRWYENSVACIAYLHDVPAAGSTQDDFRGSEWFQRGWTLQELLAPRSVIFLDQEWNIIGIKTSTQETVQLGAVAVVSEYVATATGIPENILTDYSTAKTLSTDEKRAWMANRKCTRVEDEAYCLLGICGVYMPLIYGERERAFDRLEDEIERRDMYLRRRAAQQPAPKVSTPAPSSSEQDSQSSNAKKGAELIALHDFEARSEDELNLTKGDRIEIIEKDEDFADGWYLGRRLADGASGLFPQVYTVPAPSGTRSSATKDSSDASKDSISIEGNNVKAAGENILLSPDVKEDNRRSRSHSRSRAVMAKVSKFFGSRYENNVSSASSEPMKDEGQEHKSQENTSRAVPDIKVDSSEAPRVGMASIVPGMPLSWQELETFDLRAQEEESNTTNTGQADLVK